MKLRWQTNPWLKWVYLTIIPFPVDTGQCVNGHIIYNTDNPTRKITSKKFRHDVSLTLEQLFLHKMWHFKNHKSQQHELVNKHSQTLKSRHKILWRNTNIDIKNCAISLQIVNIFSWQMWPIFHSVYQPSFNLFIANMSLRFHCTPIKQIHITFWKYVFKASENVFK